MFNRLLNAWIVSFAIAEAHRISITLEFCWIVFFGHAPAPVPGFAHTVVTVATSLVAVGVLIVQLPFKSTRNLLGVPVWECAIPSVLFATAAAISVLLNPSPVTFFGAVASFLELGRRLGRTTPTSESHAQSEPGTHVVTRSSEL